LYTYDDSIISDCFYTFSIATTGKCNCACTYCHFFAGNERSKVAHDLSKDIYKAYIEYICNWKDEINASVAYRFTGGDPLVMGDALFDLAEEAYSRIGFGPFVLTNGKGIDDQWIIKAKKSKITHVNISLENPISPDPCAEPPINTVEKISKFSSIELPLLPGVCIIEREYFSKLYDISEWFYAKIGCLPTFVEMNFQAYESPNADQLEQLSKNIEQIIQRFAPKVPVNLFPNISSELGYGGKIPFILIMDLKDSCKLASYDWVGNLEVAHPTLFSYYRRLMCDKANCPWFNNCRYTAWYWQVDMAGVSKEQKLRDYCLLKRTINDSFYRVLVDNNHKSTAYNIDTNYHFSRQQEIYIPHQLKGG